VLDQHKPLMLSLSRAKQAALAAKHEGLRDDHK
jgi:hypothetical protein